MSEEIKDSIPPKEEVKKPEQEIPKGPVRVIEVFITPDGVLKLSSTLPPYMVIYALESIKINILNNIEKQAQPIIQKPPPGGIMNFARNHFRKGG